MFSRRVKDVLAVSLKYFFDFDYVYFSHASAVLLILPCVLMLFIKSSAASIYDGLLTVKEDAQEIKSEVSRRGNVGIHKAASFLNDGLLTVKEDARDIRTEMLHYGQRLISFYHHKTEK